MMNRSSNQARRSCEPTRVILCALAGLALAMASGCLSMAKNQAAQAPSPPVCMPQAGGDGKLADPLDAPTLVRLGNAMRSGALSTQAVRAISGSKPAGAKTWDTDLRDARDCYQRALDLSPNNYEALLNMGIVYIVAAQREEAMLPLRNSYLRSAKQYLGEAYFSRQAPYDPVYYLAVVATLEGKQREATFFLERLLRDDYRPGEVYTMLGYLAERRGARGEANDYYSKALLHGASTETLEFILVQKQNPNR